MSIIPELLEQSALNLQHAPVLMKPFVQLVLFRGILVPYLVTGKYSWTKVLRRRIAKSEIG